MSSDLAQFIRSKDDLYTILAIEGQLHLPPLDDCNMEFLRDSLAGKKKLLENKDVRTIAVPRVKEFKVHELYMRALDD